MPTILRYIYVCIPILFINCSYLQSEESTTDTTSSMQPDSIVQSSPAMTPIKLDSFKIVKFKEYNRDWNASYFPIPTPWMLKRTPTEDPGYVYLVNSFDSLSYKISTDKEPSNGPPCSWKQKFKSGITYSKSTCMESGTNYTIRTSSNDKKTLVRLIDMLFYNSVNDWNNDSTEYAPLAEKAGCYYAIEKNDAGYYDLKYSCSF